MLCEIRLYIPTKLTENKETEEGEDNNLHEAGKIKEEILKLANIGSTGDEIAIIPELPLITPRGKFDLHIFKDYLKIHGHIMAKLFKAIIGINIVIPGNFRSSKNNPSIKCSLKANEGFLYPLERGLIFIHKPVVYIKLEDINYVECVRVTEHQKSFDIMIYTKKNNESYQFLGILREEYDSIVKYLALKKIKVKSIEEGTHKIIEVTGVAKSSVTSRRKKHLEENNLLELPSSESEFDDNYNSEEMDVDEDSEKIGGKQKTDKKRIKMKKKDK